MKLENLRAWLAQLRLSVQVTSKRDKHANANDGGQVNPRQLLVAELDLDGEAKEREDKNADYLSVMPQELLIYLTDFLIYPDILRFRLVSLRFRDIIPASSLAKHHEATASLIYAQELEIRGAHNIQHHNGAHGTPWSNCLNKRECLAISNSNLTCYHCYQWLFPGRFTNGMSHGSYSLGMLSAKNRLCMECGVLTGFYRKGACVGFYGAVCLRCGKLFRTRWIHSRAEGFYERWCRVCAPDRDTQLRKWENHVEEEYLRQYLSI